MPPSKRAADRGPSEKALRAAVVPFARRPRDGSSPVALLALPPNCTLVSAETFRPLAWGGGGHRDALRLGAPLLAREVADLAGDAGDVGEISLALAAAYRDEWLWVPVAVPAQPPLEGNVYVTAESGERIPDAGELYNRAWIEEGVPPKQVTLAQFEAAQVERKAAKAADRDLRKLYGETAPLGVRMRVIKTKGDGDCFFSAVCKAFHGKTTWRDPEMWRTMQHWASANAQTATEKEQPLATSCKASALAFEPASGARTAPGASSDSSAGSSGSESAVTAPAIGRTDFPKSTDVPGGAEGILSSNQMQGEAKMPLETDPPTVTELRRVCAAHFMEDTWLTCQAVGGFAFAYACEPTLEETRTVIARLAAESEKGSVHWADEISIACVQRYLNLRLLIFNPDAQPANRAVTCGEHLPGETASDERRSTSDASRPRYLVLRHTHKSTKQQHYELYSLISGNALLEEEDLPAGVKRAFAHVCPGGDLWRQLQTAQGDD